MKMDKNIDKLFRDRLKEDNPPFKEQHWQHFEAMLDKVPPPSGPGVSASTGAMGKIMAFTSLTKGVIAVISLAAITAAIYFTVVTASPKEPVLQITAKTGESSAPQEIITNSPAAINKASNIHQTEQLNTQTSQSEVSAIPEKEASQNKYPATSITEKSPYQTKANSTSPSNSTSNVLKSPKQAFKAIDKKTIASNSTVVASQDLRKPDLQNQSNNTGMNTAKSSFVAESGQKEETFISDLSQETNGFETIVEKPTEIDQGIAAAETTSKSNDSIVADNSTDSPRNEADQSKNATPAQAVMNTNQAPASKNDSKFSLYVVPGIGFYKALGNTAGFSSKISPAFQFGFGFSYRLNENFLLYAEANAVRLSGFKLEQSSRQSDFLFYESRSLTTVQNRNFTFLNVPVLLEYKYNKHKFGLGPSLRYLISGEGEKIVMDSTLNSVLYKSESANNYLAGLNRFQAGIALEYSWAFYRQNAIMIRYTWLMNDVNQGSFYGIPGNNKLNMLLLSFMFHIY